MSITAVPVSVPGLEISITLLFTVASTCPSITSTSQFEISTPFSLMLTPTKSLLPAFSSGDGATVALGAGALAGTGVSRPGGGSRNAGPGVLEPRAAGLVTLGCCMALVAVGFASGLLESLRSTQRSLRPRFSMSISSLQRHYANVIVRPARGLGKEKLRRRDEDRDA